MSVEDVYPISRVLTQDQRTTSRPTDSLEAPESLSARIRNSPAQKKLRQRVFNKLKGWFNRFFNYLSWKLCSSSRTFTYRSESLTRSYPVFLYLVELFQSSNYEGCWLSRRKMKVMWTAFTAGRKAGLAFQIINLKVSNRSIWPSHTGRCRVQPSY